MGTQKGNCTDEDRLSIWHVTGIIQQRGAPKILIPDDIRVLRVMAVLQVRQYIHFDNV